MKQKCTLTTQWFLSVCLCVCVILCHICVITKPPGTLITVAYIGRPPLVLPHLVLFSISWFSSVMSKPSQIFLLKITHKQNLYYYLYLYYLSLIPIYLDILSINSLPSECIWKFVCSILGHLNIFGYFFKPISYIMLQYGYLFCKIFGLQIYFDIYLVKSLTSKYILLFVLSIYGHPHIFGWFFKLILWHLLITGFTWCFLVFLGFSAPFYIS